jgi:hypothetical protein
MVGLVSELSVLEPRSAFLLLSLLLAVYAAAEAREDFKEHRTLASPALLASIYIFFLAYSASNFVYILPEARIELLDVDHPGFGWMSWMVALALLGNIAMWAGYRSSGAQVAGERVQASRSIQRLLKSRFESVRWWVVVGFAAVATAVRLVQFSLGIYGFNADADLFAQSAGFGQYLNIMTGLGSLALAVTALHRFSLPNVVRTWVLPTLLANEVFWGFLSGFKSNVVLPFVIVGVAAAVVGKRPPVAFVLYSVAALFVAYTFVQPYRMLRMEDPDFDYKSPTYVAGVFYRIATGETALPTEQEQTGGTGTILQASARFSITGMGARALEYKAIHGLGPSDPPFLADLVLSPVYAVVPRALWPSKSSSLTGKWAYQTMLGRTGEGTSIAIGPVSNLYLGGGVAVVLLFFYVVGLVQRFSVGAFFRPSAGSLVIYVGLLSTLSMVGNDPGVFFIDYIRYLPLLIMTQNILFAR